MTLRPEPESLYRAGWARTKVRISASALVLDVGSGSFPFARADILCERHLSNDVHRAGQAAVRDARPMVVADAIALPFRKGSLDFVVASHVAEHVEDAHAFMQEISRVALAGYIETPSPLADRLLHEDVHLWRVRNKSGILEFRRRPATRGPLGAVPADLFYRIYFAGRPRAGRPTFRSDRRSVNAVLRAVGYIFGGVANRTRLMHTRYVFSANRPPHWRIVGRSHGGDAYPRRHARRA